MMDYAGIDAAVLTAGPGMCADLERSRFINDKTRQAERDYPGRFIGAAHTHPLGGPEALGELNRCSKELGFQVEWSSRPRSMDFFLDDPLFEAFLGPKGIPAGHVRLRASSSVRLNDSRQFNAYDSARCVGREFSLIMATIRLINSGVLDRNPNLRIQMAHLSGGIASMLGRVRGFQDKEFWGTANDPRHGLRPEKDFDYYLRERMVFDTAGFCGDMGGVKTALVEIPASRIVFATDYPQEMRTGEAARSYVEGVRKLGPDGARILSSNADLLLKPDQTGKSVP